MTTPDPITLHKTLAELKEQQVDYAALEASSHGLKQHRLDGLKIKAAGFTNFTQDHLDYHTSLEDYFKSKLYLFSHVLKNGSAVINADIPEYADIKKLCLKYNHQIIDYGKNANVIKLLTNKMVGESQEFTYQVDNKEFHSKIHLAGEFQLYNILCAVGLLLACNISINEINLLLPKLKCIPGRMDKANIQGKNVYIDYAHTPDALKKALTTLRPIVKGRLMVIFGCGGNRDTEKRYLMGEVAAKNADYIIVTDDNPRLEDPQAIRKMILQACPNAIEIGDRGKAIKYALNQMNDKDVLLIAGKGHEDYQIVGKEKRYFSDKEFAEQNG